MMNLTQKTTVFALAAFAFATFAANSGALADASAMVVASPPSKSDTPATIAVAPAAVASATNAPTTNFMPVLPRNQGVSRDDSSSNSRRDRDNNRRNRDNDSGSRVNVRVNIGSDTQTSTRSTIVSGGGITSSVTRYYGGYPNNGYPYYDEDGYPYYPYPNYGQTIIISNEPQFYMLPGASFNARFVPSPTSPTRANTIPASNYYFYPPDSAYNGSISSDENYNPYYGYNPNYARTWSPDGYYGSYAIGNSSLTNEKMAPTAANFTNRASSATVSNQAASAVNASSAKTASSAVPVDSSMLWAGGTIWGAGADGKAVTIPVWSSATSQTVLDGNATSTSKK